MSGEALLEVDGLEVELPVEDGYVKVLDGVSFAVERTEVVGLVGESGSGKSMTALSIIGLLPSVRTRVRGSVRFDGEELVGASSATLRRIRGAQIGVVFQEPMTSLHPTLQVGEQIAEAVRAHEAIDRRSAWARAVEMLDLVGIPDAAQRARQYPFAFSGGMQQRVMLAIALACRPQLLIADEPTTALDVTVQAQIVSLLERLQDELGMAVLFVSHDLGLLAQICQRMVVMYGGQVVERARAGSLFARPRHPYSDALLQTAPHPELRGSHLPTIPGTAANAGRYPDGCRFHPRCPHAQAMCETALPPLAATEAGEAAVRCHRSLELDLGARRDR